MSKVIFKSEENVFSLWENIFGKNLNLRMSTVVSRAMTIHISSPLPLIAIFVSMLLAELKTD